MNKMTEFTKKKKENVINEGTAYNADSVKKKKFLNNLIV